jgi:hypothetical protein
MPGLFMQDQSHNDPTRSPHKSKFPTPFVARNLEFPVPISKALSSHFNIGTGGLE